MDDNIKEELSGIVRIIVNTIDVKQIYLFGSYAGGIPHQDSDLDIYVIIPDGSVRCVEAMQKIGRALFDAQKRPLDILVGEASAFEKRADLPTIERTVKREGVVIYDRQPVYALA